MKHIYFFDDYQNKKFTELSKIELEIINIINILITKHHFDFIEDDWIEIDIKKIRNITNHSKSIIDNYNIINCFLKIKNIDIISHNDDNTISIEPFLSALKYNETEMSIHIKIKKTIYDNFNYILDLMNAINIYKLQFKLKGKYTNEIYNIIKYNEYFENTKIQLSLFYNFLQLDNNTRFAYFHKYILQKTINEINSNSELSIFFEPIYISQYKKKSKITELYINTHIKNKNTLDKLGIKSTRRQYHEKIKNRRINIMIYNEVETIINSQGVINTASYDDLQYELFNKLNQNRNEYVARVEIEDWLDNIKYKKKNKLQQLIVFNFLPNIAEVTIDNKFRIVSLLDRTILTNNAIKTIKYITHNVSPPQIKTIKTVTIVEDYKKSYISL